MKLTSNQFRKEIAKLQGWTDLAGDGNRVYGIAPWQECTDRREKLPNYLGDLGHAYELLEQIKAHCEQFEIEWGHVYDKDGQAVGEKCWRLNIDGTHDWIADEPEMVICLAWYHWRSKGIFVELI